MYDVMERSFGDPLENYGHACIPLYHVYHVNHVYHVQVYTVLHLSGPHDVPVADVCVTHSALVESRRMRPFPFLARVRFSQLAKLIVFVFSINTRLRNISNKYLPCVLKSTIG